MKVFLVLSLHQEKKYVSPEDIVSKIFIDGEKAYEHACQILLIAFEEEEDDTEIRKVFNSSKTWKKKFEKMKKIELEKITEGELFEYVNSVVVAEKEL